MSETKYIKIHVVWHLLKIFTNLVQLESAIDTALEAFQMYDTSPKDEKLTYSEIEKVNLKLDY